MGQVPPEPRWMLIGQAQTGVYSPLQTTSRPSTTYTHTAVTRINRKSSINTPGKAIVVIPCSCRSSSGPFYIFLNCIPLLHCCPHLACKPATGLPHRPFYFEASRFSFLASNNDASQAKKAIRSSTASSAFFTSLSLLQPHSGWASIVLILL